MNAKSILTVLAVCMATLALLVGFGEAAGAEPGSSVQRAVLQRHDLKVVSGYEGVMAEVQIAPGGREGRHTHPADVLARVLEGTVTLSVDGQSKSLRAGDVFYIPAGAIHEAINAGDGPAKLLAVFVAEKGKPLTTPAK
jgi:quercetin dioxygenase-like cupin family protein